MSVMLVLGASAPSPRAAFVDPRDGQSYPLVEIAGMVWFARHLDHRLAGSYCFQDREEACATRGRLYPWPLALAACPSGWHLSTEEEWQRVEAGLGMKAEEIGQTRGRGAGVGDALKVGGASGLDVVLAGWRNPAGAYQEGNGDDRAAALWTATAVTPTTAWHRDVSSARSVVWRSRVDTPYALSVRCVRDR